MRLSEHFLLSEFLPRGTDPSAVPELVVARLGLLCCTILEPMRQHFGVPVSIHVGGGWRPAEYNARVGGVPGSDHVSGGAADFHVADTPATSWEESTIAAFNWIREMRAGLYGQLILEDRRAFHRDPGKLWVHVALPSANHDGTDRDPRRILVSYEPKVYERWREVGFA